MSVPESPIEQPRAAIAETQRHCKTPERCSVCMERAGVLAVPVQRVDVVGGTVRVDGRVVRHTVEREHAPGERFRGRA